MATKQNYVKKMEVKNKQKIDAGVISDRFPTVAGMVIKMTYYHNAENPILMHRTVNFFPESHAFFNLECMIKGCENGGFDLNRTIINQIKDKKKVIKGEMSCKGVIGEVPAKLSHSRIDYAINITFGNKTVKKAVKKTTEKAVKKTAEKAIKKTVKKAAKKTAEKAVKKTVKKAAKKTAEKAVKKTVKKAAKKTAEKAVKKIKKK